MRGEAVWEPLGRTRRRDRPGAECSGLRTVISAGGATPATGISLHLHFFKTLTNTKVIGMVEPETKGHYCAVVEFIVPLDRSEADLNRPVTGGTPPIQLRIPSDRSDEIKVPVLVEVVELGKHGQWMSLPSMVRLQTLDECHRLCGRVIEPMLVLNGIVESPARLANGKDMGFGRSSVIHYDELPNEMVKSGTEIEQTVSDDQSQIIRRLGTQPDSQDSHLIRLLLRKNLALAMFESFENFHYARFVEIGPC